MQLIVAAVGSWVGSTLAATSAPVLLGMTGAQLGWMAGSMVGSMLFSDVEPPPAAQLQDLKVQGSNYGATIPYLVGTDRMAGQVIWASDKSTTRSSTDDGRATQGESPPADYGAPGNDSSSVGFGDGYATPNSGPQ